ncbi:MAG: hypothetical protein KGL44_04820 [Sphingomonadales bacterium]|nr:hypothetical protein [Sphingomonadales bacterium]
MHRLQATFATPEGESEWDAGLRALVEAGDLAAAERLLSEEIAALDSDLGRLCLAATRDAVRISGWGELAEAVAAWPGAPVTGVTLAMGNDADLAFEKGQLHHPFMLLGLYSDEAWEWSRATRAEVLGQCDAPEGPDWAGAEEDIEVWLDVTGLDALNTALIHHKQRHFIRDGAVAEAPLRYVEFTLGCWWRALAFHRAIAAALVEQALPGAPVVVSGLVDMRPAVVCAHMPKGRGGKRKPSRKKAVTLAHDAPDEPAFDAPDMAAKGLIVRKAEEEERPLTGTDLRRRLAAAEPAPEEPKRSLLARLFGR